MCVDVRLCLAIVPFPAESKGSGIPVLESSDCAGIVDEGLLGGPLSRAVLV